MRKSFKPAILAALVAAAAAGPAFATGDGGDNGMTPWYGDSWTNMQSHAPEATAVPSLQAQEEKAPATEAWGHARDNMRARTARVRESTSNALHRLTGTATRGSDVGTAGAGATTYGSSTTTSTTSGGTMSNDATTSHGAAMSSGAASAPDPQAAPAAYSNRGVAPGPAAIDEGIRAQRNGQVTGTARDQAGPLGSGSNTGTVDPTGVGAATMGGSPYGGNQDPARLPSSGSSDVAPTTR
ncbi:MAG TPA: hypothetical protein VLR71_03145 [Casimicrobiaceae bacterium]|nr:hypothetical protein [Casimicrobiaceae bacterium]